MSKKNKKPVNPPLQHHLLAALKAIDNQIARSMQRDENTNSVQKWGPIQERIELLTSFLIENAGNQEIQLESLLILGQAVTKTLRLLAEELGQAELGQVRGGYCREAFEKIEDDSRRALASLRDEAILM